MLRELSLPLPTLVPMGAVERTEQREKLPTFDGCCSSDGGVGRGSPARSQLISKWQANHF